MNTGSASTGSMNTGVGNDESENIVTGLGSALTGGVGSISTEGFASVR
jgi:hypothetical protein